ncbi:MAG: Xaa-Pro peptidase family protein [Pseudomonadota bacterium]
MFSGRGFPESEYELRVEKAQDLMRKRGLDGLLCTTHPDIYYFTGFLTRFWESPTRPWFLVVPQAGKPIAVIPKIGEALMRTTWIDEIRTWSSPDLKDDGVTLLADTLKERIGSGKVGLPSGHETHLRMPISDFENLKQLLSGITIANDAEILRTLRMVKSPAEIEKIKRACGIAHHAFSRVQEFAYPGTQLSLVFRKFQMVCLEEGADWVPYLAGGSDKFGYADVISPAGDAELQNGDVLMLDTGLTWDGYFCDYDRNFSIGAPDQIVVDAHKTLIEATQAGFEAVKPGAAARVLFEAMDRVLTGGKGGNENGRLGHGLGIQLTEWPSLIPSDETELQAGMVLTLEPGIGTKNGNMLVHEENIVVTQSGAEYLSTPADEKIVRV